MDEINNEYPLIYTTFRKGTSDDPYIRMYEEKQIYNGMARLTEIPQKQERITITSEDNTVWVEIDDGIPIENEYRVDYNIGVVYFSIDEHDGETVRFDYKGIGQIYVSSALVYDTIGADRKIEETLKQLIDNNRVYGNLASRKEPVETFNDLANTYPIPMRGWMVEVIDENRMYIWTGKKWLWFLTFPFDQVIKNKEAIKALKKIYIGPNIPLGDFDVWFDTSIE